ncbi:MAG: chemotaxis protein CheX [Desulfuromonadaceae bacterium]|jgi:chemotaxis protein CheX
MNWEPNIIAATTEIFSTMLMMEVVPEPALSERVTKHNDSISGIIGLAGSYKGMLAIHAPAPVAMTITTNFLGMEVDSLNDDVKDAFGELANMLGGSVKSGLSENSRDIQLSIPSAVCGEEYTLDYQPKNRTTSVPFKTGEGTFVVELQLEKQE